MKLIDCFKVFAQLNDAELILTFLLKNPTLPIQESEDYRFAIERIKLHKKQLNSLLNNEQHSTSSMNDKKKKAVLTWEINDNLAITHLVSESQTLLNGLQQWESFKTLFKKFSDLRNAFIELLTTEHQFISDYQRISADKPHLSTAIDKYCSQKRPTLTYNSTNSKKLLATYDNAKNYLTLTYDELINFTNGVLYAVNWLDNKIFGTLDFIRFYEDQLFSWVLAYSSIAELFSDIKLAATDTRIVLTPEEQAAVNHIENRLIGSVQRLGRYKLLFEQIAKTVESIISDNILPLPAIARTPPQVMLNILNLISAKNKTIEKTVGAAEYPRYLMDNLSELIKKLATLINDFNNKNRGLSLFSSPTPLEQGQIDCANNLLSELNKLIMLFKQELERVQQTKPNPNELDLKEFNLYEVYSRKIRETIRTVFRQFEKAFLDNEYQDFNKLPLYQLLDSYCQKIQPLSNEDRSLLSARNSKVSSS